MKAGNSTVLILGAAILLMMILPGLTFAGQCPAGASDCFLCGPSGIPCTTNCTGKWSKTAGAYVSCECPQNKSCQCYCPYGENGNEPVEEQYGWEICSNGKDDDKDGLVDCSDPDCFSKENCQAGLKAKLSQGLKQIYIDELKRIGMDMYVGNIETMAGIYGGNPERMASEMGKFMNEKVYKTKKVEAYMSIFKDDPQKITDMQAIVERNKNDLIMRDVELETYIAENSKEYRDSEMLKGYVESYVLNPPKWLYGGEYNSGGVVDYANMVSGNIMKLEGGDISVPGGVRTIQVGTTVFAVVQDSKDLLAKAETLKQMNIDDRTKVGIIVLDGTMKIVKILDPTGYFGNMGDATIGGVIKVGGAIKEREQGYVIGPQGQALQQGSNGNYFDDDGNEYQRVSGEYLGKPVFAKVNK
ncbi:MAG: hypothetical protein NT130_03740 [Candidatus Micrarchaeota archaeon]|nr:hypothetical protein [Candidatus Micrarchaeota archaeon]